MNTIVYQILAGIAGIALAVWSIPKFDAWMHRRMEKRADARVAAMLKASGWGKSRPFRVADLQRATAQPDSDLGELAPALVERRGDNFWRGTPTGDVPIPASLRPLQPLTATQLDIDAFNRNVDERRRPPTFAPGSRPLTQREASLLRDEKVLRMLNPRRAAQMRELGAGYGALPRRTPVFNADRVPPFMLVDERDEIDPAIQAMLRTMPLGAYEPDPLVCPSDAGKTPESTGSVDPCPAPNVDLPPDVGSSGDTW